MKQSRAAAVAEAVTLFLFAEIAVYGVIGLIVVKPFPSFLIKHAIVLPILSPYGYNIILYPAYSFVLFPRWRSRTLTAFGLVYSTNELVYNALYTLRYPSSLHVAVETGRYWPLYMTIVAAVFLACLLITRPSLRFSAASAVWPAFLGVWFAAGMPIMHPYYAVNLPFYTVNFPWELSYQLTLMASFYFTVTPRPGGPAA